MPLFTYKGQQSLSGRRIKGLIEAENVKEAKIKLRRQDIYVITISQNVKSHLTKEGEKTPLLVKLTRKPPKEEDIALATKQLGILLKSAVDINEALRAICEQVENQELRAIYTRIGEMVRDGKPLSVAHAQFQKTFPPLYTNMLAAGERSGALPLVVQRLAQFMFYRIELKRKLVGALSYPALMIVVSIAVVLYLFIKIMPQMAQSFLSLNVELPWYTQLMIEASQWIQHWWTFLILSFLASLLGFLVWRQTPRGRRIWDELLYTIPLIGPLFQKVIVSRFTRTLATILNSGIRIVEALHLSKKIVGNTAIEAALEDVIAKVQDGDKLTLALEKTKRFPKMMIHMMKTGEKTGHLEEALLHIASIYEDETDHQISTLIRFIEPAMMIFMAVVVFAIVMSVIGPMMAAMNQLH